MKHYRRRRWFVFFPLFMVTALLLFGYFVMLLWNAILVPVTSVGVLTFWQGVGLLILARILVGGFSGRGWRRRQMHGAWREKWMNMSDEERERFRGRWKAHFSFGPEEHGNTAEPSQE